MQTADDTATSDRPDRKPVWIRGAFMLFFLIAFGIAQGLVSVMAVIQFLSLLIGGKPNGFIADFGRSMGRWLDQVARFQSGASDDRPFPWSDWPSA